jgi:hypothetical protein
MEAMTKLCGGPPAPVFAPHIFPPRKDVRKTDLELIKDLFTRRGIGFKEEVVTPTGAKVWPPEKREETIILTMSEGMPNVEGYGGFATVMTFGLDGQLLSIGAWE